MFAVFVASRLFYLLAGALLASIIPVSPAHPQAGIFPFGALSVWANFDGEHYVSVAEKGYAQDSPAFFPLYPLLVRLPTLLGGPASVSTLSVYGVLVSLVAFLFALYFVYRIAEEGWGVRAAQGAVLSLAFSPTSFFFNAVYTESLFLMLSTGAVWAARVRRDLLLASVLAGLATATRNVGVLLLIPLVAEWSDRREYGWRVVYLALVPSGLAAYYGVLVVALWGSSTVLQSAGRVGQRARRSERLDQRVPAGLRGRPGAVRPGQLRTPLVPESSSTS